MFCRTSAAAAGSRRAGCRPGFPAARRRARRRCRRRSAAGSGCRRAWRPQDCRARRAADRARQHLEIGVGDGGEGGQRHHLAVEAAGDRESPRRRAAARGSCPRSRSRSSPLSAALIRVLRGDGARRWLSRASALAVEVDQRQQRRAGDPRLRVGLDDAGDRRRDVEVGGQRLLDQVGQLLGAEAAPPQRSGQRRLRHCAAPRDRPSGCRWRPADLSRPRKQPPSGSAMPTADGMRGHAPRRQLDNIERCDTDGRIKAARTARERETAAVDSRALQQKASNLAGSPNRNSAAAATLWTMCMCGGGYPRPHTAAVNSVCSQPGQRLGNGYR